MKFQAKPVVVDAFKIVNVGDVIPDMKIGDEFHPGGSRRLVLEIQDGCSNRWQVQATAEMLAIYTPVAGDYWVIQHQENGEYVYINPKHVFENKYAPAVESPTMRVDLYAYGKVFGVDMLLEPADLEAEPSRLCNRYMLPAAFQILNNAAAQHLQQSKNSNEGQKQ